MKKYVYALLKSINLFRVPTMFLNTQVKVQGREIQLGSSNHKNKNILSC